MPLYMCNCMRGVITDEAKAKVAADITDAHCDVTSTSRAVVHVFFFDDAPKLPINGRSVFIFGSISAGYSVQKKIDLVTHMKASVFVHTGVPLKAIIADITDVPADWIAEGAQAFFETKRRPV